MKDSKNTVWKLIDDLAPKEGITEIVINSDQSVFVERKGKFIHLKVILESEDIIKFINDIVLFNRKERRSDLPILDGNLPDGSRINIVTPPYAHGGPVITIRKYLPFINTLDDSKELFNLDDKWVDFFKAIIRSKCNVIVSGGTSSGKTTFLNLLLQEIAIDERIIIIEDTIELDCSLPNVVRLKSEGNPRDDDQIVSTRDLVKNSLRMRPDRIIVGEVRGGEAFDLLQVMNTGHDGSMSSIHANSPSECVKRLETLYMLAGVDLPYHVVRSQIVSAVDFIIHLKQGRDGNRDVESIAEVTGIEKDIIQMHTLSKIKGGKLKRSGIVPLSIDKLFQIGKLPKNFFNS